MIIIMYAHAYMNVYMYDNYGRLCTSTATFRAPRMHLKYDVIHVAIDRSIGVQFSKALHHSLSR